MSKPIHKFEDDLGELVDRYLLDGQVSIDEIKSVLKYEADFDHAERLAELLKKERARG
jgi:hypothetical protein